MANQTGYGVLKQTTFFLRKHLLLVEISLTRRFRSKRDGRTLFLTGSICVKYGPDVRLSEAATMQYIAANTTIPVPKVYFAFEDSPRGLTYIVMSRVPGRAVEHHWEARSQDSKAHILSQLKGYVSQLRELRSPHLGYCGGVHGNQLYDPRIHAAYHGFGPFNSVAAFHLAARDGYESNGHPDVEKLVTLQKSWEKSAFSHCDLNPWNIIVNGDEISGIIDWEISGWYPEYWEYAQAKLNYHPFDGFWAEEVDKFLDPYPEALEMEALRLRWFANF